MGFIKVSHLGIFVLGSARCRIKIEMQEQASVLHLVPCRYTDTFFFLKWSLLVGERSKISRCHMNRYLTAICSEDNSLVPTTLICSSHLNSRYNDNIFLFYYRIHHSCTILSPIALPGKTVPSRKKDTTSNGHANEREQCFIPVMIAGRGTQVSQRILRTRERHIGRDT